MSNVRGDIFITKLAAAERQLNAAIRMFLSEEDELAIHTVASAAFRVLRDLKEKAGRYPLADAMFDGLYYMARDMANGEISKIPKIFLEHEPTMEIVSKMSEMIKTGLSKEEIKVTGDRTYEKKHWSEFNKPANFLKHADFDDKKALRLGEIDNVKLLVMAGSCFIDIKKEPTDEIVVLSLYYSGHQSDFQLAGWSSGAAENFSKLSDYEKKQFCLEMLEAIKQA